jgi:O-antigen ligase
MNLVWFLTIGTILSTILGEFGQFPFGANFSVSLTDILLTLTLMFLLIWQIGIKKEILLPLGFKLLGIFWALAAVSLFFSGNLSGGFYLARFILYSSSFYLGYILLKKDQVKEKNIFYLILIPTAILALIGFLQIILYPDLAPLEVYGYDPHKDRLVSSFLDPNYAGAYLNMGLLFSVYLFIKEKKKQLLPLSLGLASAVFLTFSRSALLMAFASMGLLGFFKARKLLLILVVSVLIVFAFVPRFQERLSGIWNLDVTSRERIESWRGGIEIFYSNPVLGVGFNNISSALEEYNLLRTHQDLETHSVSGIDSSIIFVLATTGVVGLISYLSFFGFILIKLTKEGSSFSLAAVFLIIALFINSQFINSLFYPPIMLILFLLMGVLYAKTD